MKFQPIVFRKLPGVAEIERQLVLLEGNKLMKDEREALDRVINEKSVELFGITEDETCHWLLPAGATTASEEQWENHFEFLEWEFDEEAAFWDAFGIDVTGEDGRPLLCIQFFGRQLVCAVKRIHPKATLAFGHGHLTDDQLKAAAEAWGRRLLHGYEGP